MTYPKESVNQSIIFDRKYAIRNAHTILLLPEQINRRKFKLVIKKSEMQTSLFQAMSQLPSNKCDQCEKKLKGSQSRLLKKKKEALLYSNLWIGQSCGYCVGSRFHLL